MNIIKYWGVAKKARPINLLLIDCDGTMTKGEISYQSKTFNVKDGLGIKELSKIIPIGFISSSDSAEIEMRAEDLEIDFCLTNIEFKEDAISELLQSFKNIAYIGDDLNDIEAMRLCTLTFAPKDAIREVKKIVNYVTNAKGGEGAVREACDIIRRYKKC